MASKNSRAMLLLALLATALSAAGWWFGAQLHPVWWLTWLAPLPILWLATCMRAHWAALTAFVAISLGGIPYWPYTHNLIGLPVSASLLSIFAPAAIVMLAVLLYRRLSRQGRHLAAAFAFPALITTALFLNTLTSINGSWGELGYTQMDALPVIQLAALTGVVGVGFLVMLGSAVAATLCNNVAPRAARLRVLGVGGGLIALALIYGVWRLHAAPATSGTPMQIGLSARQSHGVLALESAKGSELQQRYLDDTQQLVARGAEIVVIPEKIWSTPQPDVPAFGALARAKSITVVAGIDYQPAGKPELNVALAFDPERQNPAMSPTMYVKHHLLPFLMPRFAPGHDYNMLPGTAGIGLAICKDMDFAGMGRAYAARDARLLLVPAWDFNIDGWLHSRMAIMRGVESGFAIARAARNGRLTLSDDRGRVLAEANSSNRDARLVGTVYLRNTHTLYARWGNWFGWLDMGALVALLALALAGKPGRQRVDPSLAPADANPNRQGSMSE